LSIAALCVVDGADAGAFTPPPAWDAGLFAVNARARHCMDRYGPSAFAAAMKTCFIGCVEASRTRTRRVLRSTAAPIFSSFVRMVAVHAYASSVPCRPSRRRLIIKV